jgi:hypothetical protein
MHVDYICLIETLDTTRDIPISFHLRDFSEGETSRRAPSGKILFARSSWLDGDLDLA